MPTAGIIKRIAESPLRHHDRIVGAYYLLTILAGGLVLFFRGRLAFAVDLIATIFYIAISVLFWASSKKRPASDDRDLNRNVTEPVRAITFRRAGRAPRASARQNQSQPHGHHLPSPSA